jgi:phosphoglycolate phosphatase
LKKRNINTIDYSRYRDIFTFPVQNYYEELGFNFTVEPFSKLAGEYIKYYREESIKSSLHVGAIQILNYLETHNFKQIIISAMEQKALEKQIEENKVYHYFENIIGLENIHAKSKIENAKKYLRNIQNGNNIECICIGDTYHDFEVSKALNCKCILVRNGHQNLNRFKLADNTKIVNNLFDMREYVPIN